MASQITDTAIITDPVNVVLQALFLDRAKQVAPYFQGTVPGRLITHQGSNTAKWRRYEQLTPTTTALSEQTGNLSFTARTASVPSITDVTATVSRYGQFFVLNEEIDLINPTEQENELVEVLGEAAGRSLNRVTRNEMEDNSTQILGGGAASASAIVVGLQKDGIRNVQNTLQRNSARKFTPMTLGSTNINTSPITAAFVGFCHYDVEEDVRELSGFVGSESYGSQTDLFLNEFGTVGRVRWISTEEAGVTANGGGAVGATSLRSTGGANIDLYENIVMGMRAVGTLAFDLPEHPKEVYEAGDELPSVQIIHKRRGSSGVADPFDEVSTIAWKSWLVPKILNGNWIRRVTTGASDLTD
tara:strand:+ start:8760 stop:9833 length:1074 start_codon:yes stop_codon:yes gene_type:complete